MPRTEPTLPHQSKDIFLTDGGTETWLLYKRGFELPHFSAFHLLNDPTATAAIREYYRSFADIAVRRGTPFIFDSLTYRASRDWGQLLGYSDAGLAEMNERCLDLYREIAVEAGLPQEQTVISGCIGPKGDAYKTNATLTADAAEAYHAEQIATFKAAGAHIVTALTLNTSAEAIGIARAAQSAGIPSVIAFTLEKDRNLRSGETLREAIETVDAATGAAPAYYMINCSHPVDFGPALEQAPWVNRIGGLRANASTLDHGTLCQLGHLEEGDPNELSRQYADLRDSYPAINVFGGCCGTDHVHVDKIAGALLVAA
ncbi:homocysteine S-methyltransferase family protein [Ponticoccus sp. SC2-23]|uniref:homocysteine S-methyltransferase family protein n=1 Tax=Alexandriicola marinus TaxID=2081710 RepID=UPI000FD7D301|nr:homocysteine S-methyltransferase family protein [Alexandriicola marinus]MBM1220239.1 homocysteine S-methyltransferase family protein [Ponticoccus sp. SC6-9]MBM1224925.1 homocysteine S-methyltransferase family protein [Ponticoccus sp. SC6-15]MBM1228439.1 homocysteine S-methyltransferase family protein [Ponticoccus sp. SC6-38]MBM1233924.1 homocysteine S-methyltransferase family protein [Ponticoccus sp. SC6-45]MBM1238940.1 homocysteine S-methyltransferase family protein [Ponticoccus sp. SC6-49